MLTAGRIRVIALWLADMLCVGLVWLVVVLLYRQAGELMRAHGFPDCTWGGYDPVSYVACWPILPLFAALNALLGLCHGSWMYPSSPLSPVEEFRRLWASSLLLHAGLVAFFAFAYGTTDGFSRVVASVSGVLVALLAQPFRNVMRRVLYRLGWGQIPVMLAGGGTVALHAVLALRDVAEHAGIRIVGYFDGTERLTRRARQRTLAHDGALTRLGVPYLGSLRDIVPESKRRDIKMLLACQDERLFRVQMEEFAAWFTFVAYIPSEQAFPVFGARAVCFDGVGGIEMVNQGRMKMKRFQKRVLDMVLAFFVFVALSPLFMLIPALIKLSGRGPVFFRHERVGRSGKPFRVWKFRTMHVDAEARLAACLKADPKAAKEWKTRCKLRCDPRVTFVGRFLRKTSLDELPQLFNVFRGEMSLIGPRPVTAAEVSRYGKVYTVVSSVRPGVTGLWQVSGRSDVDYGRRVALDTYYVLNWSSWMDFWILLKTVKPVLFMRGAR